MYFLRGVARQSEDAVSRSERMNQLLADWRELVSASSSPMPAQGPCVLREVVVEDSCVESGADLGKLLRARLIRIFQAL